MTSDKIPALGFDASGTLRGKARIRMYWAKALTLLPNLRFELIDTYVSPDSIVVFYQTLRTTPAMAAGVTARLWEIGDIVDVLEAWENSHG